MQPATGVSHAPSIALTAAEEAIADGLLRGRSYKQISHERGTSIRTVANQVGSVFRKLDIHSRAELCHRFERARLLPRESTAFWRPSATPSARGRAVLVRRALGHSLKLIAYDLDLSMTTVHRVLQRGMGDLGVRTLGELAPALARGVGFEHEPEREAGSCSAG